MIAQRRPGQSWFHDSQQEQRLDLFLKQNHTTHAVNAKTSSYDLRKLIILSNKVEINPTTTYEVNM